MISRRIIVLWEGKQCCWNNDEQMNKELKSVAVNKMKADLLNLLNRFI